MTRKNPLEFMHLLLTFVHGLRNLNHRTGLFLLSLIDSFVRAEIFRDAGLFLVFRKTD